MRKITTSVLTTTIEFVASATIVPVTTPCTPPTSFCSRERISPERVVVKNRSDWRISLSYIRQRRSNITPWRLMSWS